MHREFHSSSLNRTRASKCKLGNREGPEGNPEKKYEMAECIEYIE